MIAGHPGCDLKRNTRATCGCEHRFETGRRKWRPDHRYDKKGEIFLADLKRSMLAVWLGAAGLSRRPAGGAEAEESLSSCRRGARVALRVAGGRKSVKKRVG